MCIKPKLAASSAYRYYKCRCARCLAWKSEAAYRTNDRDKAKERAKQWRLKNVERSRHNAKIYQTRHPEQVLKWQLKKYGITVQQYHNLLGKLAGRCHICGKYPTGMQHGKLRLCVDHDHKTGKVRGLLCGACNIGIGHFSHDTKKLESAIEYIIENGDVY